MTIIYPLSLPNTTDIRSVRLLSEAKVGMTESEFTFNQQVYEWQGQRWAFEVALVPLKGRAEAEPWVTFFLKLNGKRGTFLFGDPAGATPRGIATGTPLIMGASQTGQDLITDGWTISQTGILKAGDYIQLGSDLYKQLDDVNSNGTGGATLTLWPSIRTAYADNAPITVSGATGTFRMASNVMPADIDEALFYGLSFSCIQAI